MKREFIVETNGGGLGCMVLQGRLLRSWVMVMVLMLFVV